MAKKIRRFLAITMALALCFMLTSPSASAWGWGPPGGGNNNDDSYEWYEVYVQGNLVASGQGRKGDVYFLGTHYEAGVNINGNSLTWHINPIGGSSGNFSGTVNLFDYIEIPEGYEVQDYDIEELSIDGVNDPYYDMYDNAVIRITIKSLYNEETDDTIIIPDPDPTEPEPTEPEPTEPEPTEPEPTEPEPTEPEPTEPEPTEPEPTEPEPTEPVDYDPVLTITKTADKEVYEVGETVTWTITVTNTGEDTAYDIVVEDPLTGDTWEIEYLEAGESRSFTATSTAELAGSLENIATVEWTDNDEIDDAEETDEDKSATDSETVTVEEPEVIEPDPTDPTEPDPTDPTEPDPTEPEPIQPEPTEPDDNDQPDITSDSYLIIPDEDVPLADVPVTGDMAILWAAISLFSGGGLILLNKKRKED